MHREWSFKNKGAKVRKKERKYKQKLGIGKEETKIMINFKKLLAGTLSAAMVLGTMAMPAFADESVSENTTVSALDENDTTVQLANTTETAETRVAMVEDKYYTSIDEAVAAAQAATTDKWNIAKITLLTNDALDISKGPENYVSYNITKNDTVVKGERIADDAHKEYYKLTNASTLYIPADVDSLILENVKNLCRIELAKGADVTLKLNGDNELAGNIFVPEGAKLTIEDVTADGSGRLAVYNTADKKYIPRGMNAFGAGDGYSAAIGGSQTQNGGEIVIKSGEIEAYSNYGSAIGGGQQKTAKVTILDGKIKAEASYGPAIGGGQQSTGDVIISGGIVNAHSDRNVVIGGGRETGSNVIITGGKITVTRDFDKNKNLFGNNVTEKGNGAEIKGGSFDAEINISDYAPKGTMVVEEDGISTVKEAKARVIDTVKFSGMTITLTRLDRNKAIDLNKDMDVTTEAKTPSENDVKIVNKKIEEENDTNTSKQIVDITPVANGADLNVTEQPVSISFTETLDSTKTVNVYHVVNGVADKVESTTDNNTVTFTAPSFSTYAITYTPVPMAKENITSKVGVTFTKVEDTENQYYVTLKALDGKNINRFMSSDLVFKNESTGVDYEITPAANINANVVKEDGASREYHFEMNGSVASSATGSEITLGTITFNGFGTVKLSVDTDYTSAHAINIVNTAKASDNIVDNYTVAAGTLVVNDVANNGVIDIQIDPETENLTVKVSFPNAVKNNAAAYQNMKVTVSGNGVNEVAELGTDANFTEPKTTGTEVTPGYYTVNFENKLVKNNTYTVTVSGAGYRTARYTVSMTGDKELNFWNNVKTAPAFVEEGVGTGSRTNFLAGDIVKDGQINIYDLSAVVSYFGQAGIDTSKVSQYAKYDLNRDGVIDSMDVAYVLVSWGK